MQTELVARKHFQSVLKNLRGVQKLVQLAVVTLLAELEEADEIILVPQIALVELRAG